MSVWLRGGAEAAISAAFCEKVCSPENALGRLSQVAYRGPRGALGKGVGLPSHAALVIQDGSRSAGSNLNQHLRSIRMRYCQPAHGHNEEKFESG